MVKFTAVCAIAALACVLPTEAHAQPIGPIGYSAGSTAADGTMCFYIDHLNTPGYSVTPTVTITVNGWPMTYTMTASWTRDHDHIYRYFYCWHIPPGLTGANVTWEIQGPGTWRGNFNIT